MNFSQFIASRIYHSSTQGFLKSIVRISIITVALSTTVLIVSSAIISGFKTEIRSKIFGFWGHIHITVPTLKTLFETEPLPKKQVFYPGLDSCILALSPNLKAPVHGKSGIENILPYAMVAGILVKDQIFEGLILKGVDQEYLSSYVSKYLVEGLMPSFAEDTTYSRQIIISRQIANRLKISPGDPLSLHFVRNQSNLERKVSVAGIYHTGLDEYDKKIGLVDLRLAQSMLGWEENQISGFEVFLNNLDEMDAYSDVIYNDILPDGLYCETIKEKFPNIFDWLELQNLNEYLILGLMIVVAIINLMTILLIFILERTHMIGILKTLGADNWQIRSIFLRQALRILTWGMIIGNATGLTICWLQDQFKFIKLNEQDYYVSFAPMAFSISQWVVLNVIFFITTMLTLIIPTWIIARMSPIKNLRFI